MVRLKSFLEILKEYFTIILFIPLLFGGIIQIVILFLISPQTIRFFSATQAISDGLLFLIFTILYLICVTIFMLLMIGYGRIISDLKNKNPKKENLDEEGENLPYKFTHERMPFWGHILMSIFAIIGFYWIFKDHIEKIENGGEYSGRFFNDAIVIFMFNFVLSLSIMRLIYFKKEYCFAKNRKTFILINIILCSLTTLIFSIFSSRNNNVIGNFKYIQDNFCCEKSGFIKVLYYNDKYIFIKRKCNGESEEILIEKFDALFEKRENKDDSK